MNKPTHCYLPGRAWRNWLGKHGELVLHRVDGPAVENDDGRKEWWVRGKYVAYEYDGVRFGFFEGTTP